MTSKRFLGFTVRTWWTLVIAVAVSCFSSLLVVNYLSDRSNHQFQHTLILSQRQFQQATRISTAQNAYSINKSVCVLRTIALAQIGRLELTKTKGYKQAEVFWKQILDNQVPVPPTFDCKNLPPKPPK